MLLKMATKKLNSRGRNTNEAHMRNELSRLNRREGVGVGTDHAHVHV